MKKRGNANRKRKPAGSTARLAAQRNALALQGINEGIYDWDIARDKIYYSPSVYRALGLTPRHYRTPKGWRNRIHPEDQPKFDAALVAHFKGEAERFECDYRFLAADGSWRWARQHGIAIRDRRGRAARMVGSTGDITHLKSVEEALRNQIALTEAIVKQLPSAVFTKDARGRFTMVNRGWSEMSGFPAAGAIGKTVHDIYAPELAQRIAQEDAQLLAQGAAAPPLESVHHGPRPNQWRIVRKAVLCGEDGSVQGLISSSTDISELKRVEAELRDQVALTRALIEENPSAMYLKDTQGRYLTVNDAWLKMVGLTRERAIGRSVLELFPEKESERYHAEDMRLLAAGEGSSEVESLRTGPDGKPQWVIIRKAVLRRADGSVIGLIGANTDITRLKQYEAELAAERQRLALVVNAAKAGIVDWDTATETPWYSERFKEMLGYPADHDTSAWPGIFGSLAHPEDRDRSREVFFKDLVTPGEPDSVAVQKPLELRLRRADGGWLWVQSLGLTLRDEQGEAKRYLAAVTDISARREQEEALRNQVKFINDLFDSVPLALAMRDPDGRFLFVNREWERLLGSKRDDVVGTLLHERLPREEADAIRDGDLAALARGPAAPVEVADFPFRGRHLMQTRTVMSDAYGQVLGVLVASLDITERRAMEEALKESVRLREEVERMSRHDLKTPLSSVIAMSRLLRESARVTPEDAELLGTIERAGYRILNMVNLSLDLFRMETGTYQFNPMAVDLAEVARRVAADLESQAASKNIDVRVRANGQSAATQEVLVRGDELLCYSMFANLVKNAIEASPAGSAVSISVRKDGDSVDAEVHNAGEVPEAMRGRFFLKYATTGKSAGLGLGTYSARLMARVQEGDLTLETPQGGGTTLVACLKAADESLPRATESHADADARAEASGALSALKVLVVDDDEFNRLVLRRYLPSPPLSVAFAVNGRAALDAAARDWPDVVLLDLEMPVMDGYEAARKLREMEQTQNLKRCLIVAISSNDEEPIKQRARAAGCDQYVVKPAPRRLLWSLLGGPGAAAPAEAAVPRASDPVVLDADLRQALPEFLSSRAALLDDMPKALAAGDRVQFRRLAHRLAGSFALFGFKWAAAQARAIEADALQGDAAQLGKRVVALRTYLDKVNVQFAPAPAATGS